MSRIKPALIAWFAAASVRSSSKKERTHSHRGIHESDFEVTSFTQEVESSHGCARGVAADGEGGEVERNGLVRGSVVFVNEDLTCGARVSERAKREAGAALTAVEGAICDEWSRFDFPRRGERSVQSDTDWGNQRGSCLLGFLYAKSESASAPTRLATKLTTSSAPGPVPTLRNKPISSPPPSDPARRLTLIQLTIKPQHCLHNLPLPPPPLKTIKRLDRPPHNPLQPPQTQRARHRRRLTQLGRRARP